MPPKKRPTGRPSSVRAIGGTAPQVVRLTTTTEPKPVEMVPLFYIDDVEYCIPAALPANLALKYLRKIRKEGPDIAADWLFEEVLSEDAYEALANHNFDDDAQFWQLFQVIEQRALGQMERQAGNG